MALSMSMRLSTSINYYVKALQLNSNHFRYYHSLSQRSKNFHRYQLFNTKSNNLDCSNEQWIVDDCESQSLVGKYIIHWRGEGVKGYSMQFRQLEFTNAYNAILQNDSNFGDGCSSNTITRSSSNINKVPASFQFADATPSVDELDDAFGAMQYIRALNDDSDGDDQNATTNTTSKFISSSSYSLNYSSNLVKAAQRCSLVRHVYKIVAEGDTYKSLAHSAIDQRLLNDLMVENVDDNTTTRSKTSWSMRLRQYNTTDNKGKRFGTSKRSSMSQEKEALNSMSTLLQNFKGPVKLKKPDCPLYVFQGLIPSSSNINNDDDGHIKHELVLSRLIASGRKTSFIAPKTRICYTRTPLCPVAAFIMCNAGRIKDGDNVLDPYAGSCTTLLAATMIADVNSTVGIDIADNTTVNRDDIVKDFQSRSLNVPKSLIVGDCTDLKIRNEAREAINDIPFDVILADPPYGIREAIGGGDLKLDLDPPLIRLVECLAQDIKRGKPLLKKGGRLVAFVPEIEDSKKFPKEEADVKEKKEEINLQGIPNKTLIESAGLELVDMKEQPLSDSLSRWLVIYECII